MNAQRKQSPRIFTVGVRYSHHARHSGYERFARILGIKNICLPLVKDRSLQGKAATWPVIKDLRKKLNTASRKLLGRKYFPYSSLCAEIAAAIHMATNRRRSIYHVLYGETDLHILPKVSRRFGHILVASFHEPPELLPWFGIEDIIMKIDAAILVSHSQREYFSKLLPESKIYLLRHAVNTEFFSTQQTSRNDRRRKPCNPSRVCLSVGSHLRDFKTLSEAITLIRKEDPSITFVAVGAKREAGAGLSILRHPAVTFMDSLTDNELLNTYRSSCLTIIPARYATANNALLEGMACGLPVVATNTGGMKEYIPEGGGLLVPERDPHALADAIKRLANDDELRSTMGQKNRVFAESLDERIIARKARKLYKQIWIRCQM